MRKVGDYVRIWFDTGAMGPNILFGRVIQAGPRAFVVMWESGLTNRIRQGDTTVEDVGPDLIDAARRAMKDVKHWRSYL